MNSTSCILFDNYSWVCNDLLFTTDSGSYDYNHFYIWCLKNINCDKTMIFRIPSLLLKLFISSTILWIVLSTVVPQVLMNYAEEQIQSNNFEKSIYPYNSLTSPTPLPIQNSTVYFIIGHPDDEVMFFSPSLIEISKKKNNNDVHLLCFSNGDSIDRSIGKIREEELYESARILGLNKENVIVLDKFKDGMNETWDAIELQESLEKLIGSQKESLVLITFDEKGVSHHPNHISLYYGTLRFFRTHYSKNTEKYKLFVLKSLNFWEKYSFTLLNNVELFVDHLSKLLISNILGIKINISFFNKDLDHSSIKFYSDLNMLSVGYAAMSYGHFSQMVWFRYGWLLFSRYLTFNHLIEIN